MTNPNTDCKTLQERGGWWEDILANRCSFPIAPINTFTNLAYMIAGVYAWYVTRTPASISFMITMLTLGIGSGLYHGFKTLSTDKLDDGGMYAVFSALMVYTLNPQFIYVAPLMLLIAALVVWRVNYSPQGYGLVNTFMGIFVALIALKLFMTGAALYALAGLGVFGVAYAIWWMDQKRTFWFPRWGHGLWHILASIAITIFFFGVK